MKRNFRSFVEPKEVLFLKEKLAAGEVTPEECKEFLERLMLRKYKKKQLQRVQNALDDYSRSLNTKTRTLWRKVRTKMEACAG